MVHWWGKQRRRQRLQQLDEPASTYTYYASRSDSSEAFERRQSNLQTTRLRWLRRLPSLLAAFGLLVSVGYLLSLTNQPKISQVSIDPNAETFFRNDTEYQSQIQTLLATSFWNRTKLTINTGDLATKIKQDFPELDDVEISIPLFNRRLSVVLIAVRPALILRSPNSEYVLDHSGRAIVKTTDAKRLKADTLPLVTDTSGLAIDLGKTMLTIAEVKFIRQLTAQLQAKGLTVESLTLPAIPHELQARLNGQPYYVKFDMLGDARQQAGTLLAVKARLEADHKIPNEYMDVRVEERAYYK